MAFGTISTLYLPIAGSAGSSMWGTDVRKLLSAADETGDNTTVCNYGTNGAVQTRTADPYTNNNSDLAQDAYGWAIDPADMGSTADFIRSYPAGNHTINARITQSGLSAVNVTLLMYVYRVGPAPTRTRTLLGSNSTTQSIAALGAEAAITVTVALGAITFAADETIQYSFEMQATGVSITGRSSQFRTGTTTRIETPELKTIAATVGSGADGVATATASMSAIAGMVGTAAGAATALGAPTAITSTVGTAAGAATASGVLGAHASMTGTAAGVAIAAGSLAATASMAGTSAGVATASGALSAVAGMTGTAAGTSTALGVPSSVAGTVGTAAGTSTALGVTGKILGTVGTVEIGAAGSSETIIRPIFFLDA